jgi:hypothetical protein
MIESDQRVLALTNGTKLLDIIRHQQRETAGAAIWVAYSRLRCFGPGSGRYAGRREDNLTHTHEALCKERQMYETGLANVSIKDQAEHKIDGDNGKRKITEDLRAV